MAEMIPPASSKIARRIQIQIGVVIALVIVAVTLLAYKTSIGNMREDALAGLVSLMTDRANYDSAAFVEAEQNTYLLRDEYLRRLAAMGKVDAATATAKASPLPLIEDIEKNVWANGGAAWRN